MTPPEITPAAEKLAIELSLEIEEIRGTGKGGKITIGDVKRTDREQAAGERPADIKGRGIRIWNDVKKYLELSELWHPINGELLGLYVRAIITADDARRNIEKFGPTAEGSQGQVVTHPIVKIKRDAELDVLKYATALLITPEAQQRHRGGAPETPDEDDFDLGF